MKALLLFLVFCGLQYAAAREPKILFQAEKSQANVLSSDHKSTSLYFSFQGLDFVNVETEKGTFTELIIPMGYAIGEVGEPKLPAVKKLIEIPFGAELSVNITGYTTEEYRLSDFEAKFPLMPVQPSLRRDQDIKDIGFKYNAEHYTRKSYIEPELANIEVLGVMRGMRIGRLTIAPVHYNPDKETIKVYNNLRVEIIYKDADIDLTNYIKVSTYSPFFDVVYNNVINPLGEGDIFDLYPDITKYPIKMVVVSHPDFEETLQPFIEWKTIQGFKIIEAYTDEIGSTSSDIKDFIHYQYHSATPEDPAPTFIVLVGDTDKLPASGRGNRTNVVTDLFYASADGDYFPDMYLGRLSARNVQELKNQIDKILYYQKYKFDDPSYLNDATFIAGADATWNPRIGQPTVKYATDNYFNTLYGFNNVNRYLTSYSGCYDEERIAVSLINFTAHCSSTSWSDPTLSASAVHSMTNTGRYPIAVGNCCQSALFSHSESIGEAWVRAEKRGAVAYIGAAPNTHWFEDFYWAVGAFPIEGNNNGYVPSKDETTLGAYDSYFISDFNVVASKKFVGNLAITEAHIQGYQSSSNTEYYWEAYHTLGDPSTMMYLTEASTNQVSYMEYIPANINEFTVHALPGSYVALSSDGKLHGAAFIDKSGIADVPIEPFPAGSIVTLAVTKSQHIPYIHKIPALEAEGPYITLSAYTINDEHGNNNGVIDYSEKISLHINARNIGNEPAINVNAILSTEDVYYSVIEDDAFFGNVNSGDNNTVFVENAFTIMAADNIPDQHRALFEIVFSDGENEWISSINLIANAPKLEFKDFSIQRPKSISDIDPGETADINITLINKGHSATNDVYTTLLTTSSWVTVNTETPIEITPLLPNSSKQLTFNITALEETPLEISFPIKFTANTGAYSFDFTKDITIGELPVYIMGESDTVISCAGKFYDNGGPDSNYANNKNIIMTFKPSKPGHVLKFDFLSFNLEQHDECEYDRLKIYNGTGTSSELIGIYCGTNSPGTVIAKNEAGALTFHFVSDVSIADKGWEALFSCVDISQPPPCAANPYPHDGAAKLDNISDNTLRWDAVSTAFAYDIYFDEKSFQNKKVATVNNNFYEPSVTSYSKYVWKVVPHNPAGYAESCPEWYFLTGDLPEIIYMDSTNLITCNALFYDSGGPYNNYSDNENYTFTVYPSTDRGKIKAEFINFGIEASVGCAYDKLSIYNGINTEAALIGTYCGNNTPGTVIADNEYGALTFHFVSDASVNMSGWAANISCTFDYDVYSVVFDIFDDENNKIYYPAITLGKENYKPGQYEIKYLAAGTYRYVITKEEYRDYQGEFDIIDRDLEISVILKKEGTLVYENNLSGNLKIYPNPTRNIINAEINSALEKAILTLMNYHGQVLEIKNEINTLGNSIIQFDLTGYPPGLYYLRADFGDNVFINKIILQ